MRTRQVKTTPKDAGQHSLMLTATGLELLRRIQDATGFSRADVVIHLLVRFRIKTDVFGDGRVWFAPKVYPPISLWLTEQAKRLLDSWKARTGHSSGDVIEAFLVQRGVEFTEAIVREE